MDNNIEKETYHVEFTDNGLVATNPDGWSAVYITENQDTFATDVLGGLDRFIKDKCWGAIDIEITIRPSKSKLFKN